MMNNKRIKFVVTGIFLVCSLLSCSKKDQKSDSQGKGSKKLTDVVPAAYLQNMKDKGLKFYEGTKPPALSGTFKFSPWRFDYKGFKDGHGDEIGEIMSYDLIMSYAGQKPDQTINPTFKDGYLGGVSIDDPFITGAGNNFTVCFTVYLASGSGANFLYKFAYLISGTIGDGTLQNIQMASVCVKNSGTPQADDLKGNFKIYSDADGTSEMIP